MHIKHIAEAVHQNAKAKGFHPPGQSIGEYIKGTVANIHGEVSELWEAYRKGNLHKPCDKPCGLTCAEEELADIVIRAFDTAERLEIDIEAAILKKHEYNVSRPHLHGGKLA